MRALVSIALLAAACSGDASGTPDDSATADARLTADARPTVEGIIQPTGGELELTAASFYAVWKDRYAEPACGDGQWRIRTGSATAAYTVSEGHAYGMLAAALYDDRALFDGLLAYYHAHPSENAPALMAWAQDAQCGDVQGASSAADADLDIAYALLVADARWNGYRDDADAIIAAILEAEVHPAGTVLLGDWVTEGSTHYGGARSSDLMPGHLRAFAAASGDARWDDVLDRTYTLVAALQADDAPATGLLPDFIVDATTADPSPAPAGWLEGASDGDYAWNACRVPWRLATDAILTGEPRARDAVRRINAWIRTTTGDDPAAIRAGYALDGTPLVDYEAIAFTAPLAVSAMVEPASGTNQAWLDALWHHLLAAPESDYYGDSIKLVTMAVLAGLWR